MATKRGKLPKDLQLGDSFFIIEKSPMDDHKLFPSSEINHYSLLEEKVKGINLDERDESIVLIKGSKRKEYTAPATGKNKDPEVGDVISDIDLAYETAIKMAKEEQIKANKLRDEADKVVKGVEGNIKALTERAPGGAKETVYSKKSSAKSFTLKDYVEENDPETEEVDD